MENGFSSARNLQGSILYSSIGRTQYGFDVFALSLPTVGLAPGSLPDRNVLAETRLTDGKSINFNGQFIQSSKTGEADSDDMLAYVSERSNGCAQIYCVRDGEKAKPLLSKGHRALHYDRPSVVGDKVFFVSAQENPRGYVRKSWNAVYCNSIETGQSVRFTPKEVADFSPSISPSGEWVAVASDEGRGWEGEVDELHTDLYVFSAVDGGQRTLVARNAGWPTWSDDTTIFFHRRADDGWWSVYKISIPANLENLEAPLDAERITPPCVHAFTPAASRSGDWIAVATRRPESDYRHVEIFHLASREFTNLTVGINPKVHHYNPFVSPSSRRIGYHRCRDLDNSPESVTPRLEVTDSPLPGVPVLRVDGFFPSVSPCGQFIAYIPRLPGSGPEVGMYVVRADASKKWKVCNEGVFGTQWDKQRRGAIYTTCGPIFQGARREVQVAVVSFNLEDLEDSKDEVSSTIRLLTKEGTGNNAFPAASPDGKHVVFRSGRDGYKNLYVMDAERGEEGGIRRLTEGNWTDTMPDWSPDGEWIAFSSSRDAEDAAAGGEYALYMVKPDGSELRKLHKQQRPGSAAAAATRTRGRMNHVSFSPDSKSVVFTSDLGGVCAEPISFPNQFQPYGELWVSRVEEDEDEESAVRLTLNAYENGTPHWTPSSIPVSSSPSEQGGAHDPLGGSFQEPHFLGRITEQMKAACCIDLSPTL